MSDFNSQFPPYEIKDGVATLFVKARNGYVHNFRVPADETSADPSKNALPFLKRMYPFEVSTGGQRKKLFKTVIRKNGRPYRIPLHELWGVLCSMSRNVRKIRCRNHNWLDWTGDNLYVRPSSETQDTFEARSLFHRSLLSDHAMAILACRANAHRFHVPSSDPDIADIFREAQMVPRAAKHPRGCAPAAMEVEPPDTDHAE